LNGLLITRRRHFGFSCRQVVRPSVAMASF
jgi:hypothetical protein